MDEYIKRDDIFNVISIGRLEYPECNSVFDGMETEVRRIPSADVAEVVRCKDCFHGHKTSYPSELRICLITGCAHSENHFCSDGKRMDGGT